MLIDLLHIMMFVTATHNPTHTCRSLTTGCLHSNNQYFYITRTLPPLLPRAYANPWVQKAA
eukprot:m.71546 g.71546  ORF g.71546 m.71546 type:complete len:61 (-) comp16085_c0_seq2:56-238(-)